MHDRIIGYSYKKAAHNQSGFRINYKQFQISTCVRNCKKHPELLC